MNIYLFCLFDCLFVGLFVLPFSTFVILKRKNRHISFQILFLVVSNLYANYKNSESNFKQSLSVLLSLTLCSILLLGKFSYLKHKKILICCIIRFFLLLLLNNMNFDCMDRFLKYYAKSGFYNKSLVLTNRFRYPVLILFYVALVNNVHDKWLKRRCRYWMNNRKRLTE